jgi:aryl-alcohol dehydrogenase-like predicted oxidoreductase
MARVADFARRLILGTAAFGEKPYGVMGTPVLSYSEISSILSVAHAAGIRCLDVSHAYQANHRLICAEAFEVILKGKSAEDILRSYWELKGPSVRAILYHGEPESLSVTESINSLHASHPASHLGASLYSDTPLPPRWNAAEVPINLFDRRFVQMSYGYTIARSVFLQGSLFCKPDQLPEKLKWAEAYFAAAWGIALAFEAKPAQLSLSLALDCADTVIIGVTSVTELEEILNWEVIPGQQTVSIERVPEKLIDPRQW